MIRKERRRHFFINKPFQLRYMLTVSLTLLTVTLVSLISLYFGIWGGVLDAFSDSKIQNDILTASRIEEYEQARRPLPHADEPVSLLSFFKQAERLSERQREIFKELIDQANRKLAGELILLLALIAWGTIFLSHKIAGPFFRFQRILESLAQGDLVVRCRLRKFDEAKPVAESFNETLESLDAKISRLKRLVQEAGRSQDQILPSLKEELSKFKTSSDH